MTPERRDELERLLVGMGRAIDGHYLAAALVGQHQFIEFGGIMREYVNICRNMLEAGKDFQREDLSGIRTYQRAYIAEKLDCIFRTSLDSLLAGKADQ